MVIDNTGTGIELNCALNEFLIEVATLPAETEMAVGGIDVSFHSTTDAAITTINKTLETVSTKLSKLSLCQSHSQCAPANRETSVENSQAAESWIRKEV